MAASKLSPQERLMRKRNAARLRQQRCRARKRQAMIERRNRALAVPKTPPPTKATPKSPPKVSLPPRKLWKARVGTFNPQSDYLSDESTNIRPRVISFDNDSVRSRTSSFDSVSCSSSTEGHRQNNNSSPASSLDSPSPVNFVRELPNKEEAAIDAMLSLKSSSSSQKLYRPVPTVIRAPVVYANCWNPMVYQARPRLYLPEL